MKLYYEADGVTGERNVSDINVEKETRTFIYFEAGWSMKYRYNKMSGTVEYKWGNRWMKMDGYLK